MEKSLTRADFVTGGVLFALGGLVLLESWRMPRFEHLEINPYTVPGIVPAILGVLLCVMGLLLGTRAARAGGWQLGGGEGWQGVLERVRQTGRDPSTWRMLLVVGLTVVYAGVLVAWIRAVPFWLATWLFVTVFIAVFEWPEAKTAGRVKRTLVIAAVQGVAVAVVVTLVFERIFLVRLP